MFKSREDLFEAIIEILRSISMESILNNDSFYSKSFVISIRHHERLKLGGTPCRNENALTVALPPSIQHRV
jgi:hypothetical protein